MMTSNIGYILMESDLEQVRRFAEDIVHRVREQVAQHRAPVLHEGN